MKNRRFHVGLVLCMALCLLLFAPASADYSRALLKQYCQAWTAHYEEQGIPILVEEVGVTDPWINVTKVGDYKMYKSGVRHTIVEALTSSKSPVRVVIKAAVLIDLFEVSIFEDGLDETPKRMKILIEGSELASANVEIFRDGLNTLYNFKFSLKDFYAFAGLMRRGAQIRFEFTTDRGVSGVTISEEDTPDLYRSIQLQENGMYFCGYMGSQKGDESLLPGGAQEKPAITPKPTAEPTPKPTPEPAPKPTADSGVPSELQGKTFSKGDKDVLVTRIKMRMQETGYYLPSATMNDEFNESMVRRVKQLQEKNGLSVTGVMDAQTLERLFSDQVVRGEFDALPASGVTAKPTAKPTPKPTPQSNVPFALRGKTYVKGDRGSVVTRIKARMQQMGYYRRTATFDDEYNDTMVQRVKQIQERNRLPATGIMDPQTMEKLYDDKMVRGEFYAPSTPKPTPRPTPKPTPRPTRKPTPKPTRTPEPRVTLVLPKGGRGEWKSESGDKMLFRVKVKNESKKRTVTAFKLYFYTEDIWGERDPEVGTVYTVTTKKNVKPGKTAFSDYIALPHRSRIYRVHAAISDVRYSDGTIEEVYFPDYFCWEIK